MFRAAAIGVTLFLAACASGPRIVPEAERPAPTERPTPVAPRPIQPGLPQDVQRHRIALLVPLSGPNAGVGRSLQNATQLAVLDTRSDALRITTYDTAAPGGAAAAAAQAISDGNRLILGPLLAEEAREVAPIARRARVPVLSFSNDAGVAGNGTYILGYVPAQSIERVVNYAKRSGITEFAGLIPSGLYGERASTAFLRSVEDAGGKVNTLETYDGRPGSMATAVAKIGRSPFQAILVAGSADGAVVAAPLIRRQPNGKAARLLGTELWNTDSAIGGKAALAGAWFASVPDNYYRQYATKYRARFGAAPYRLSTLGYDAVLLTVRIAREWRPGDEFPAARLVEREGFAGLDGAFRFGRDGVAERALEVQEIRGGTTATVSPAPPNFNGN
ncbi:penicillin-binding protein activator [Sphingomonas psychrotolerans]|uniref:Penicillin-binding protein activator n=1 Tax=Sphingomonas psychrotolerans TaxID=1327635 RepID=A0ABU3N999_9SPHN|nr:penicillin-binding protein activator [Sphingomonas psychrotolerans]MDT8761085.1 penicillin-binding protein activator [Sphingomonas psychrotolerans]